MAHRVYPAFFATRAAATLSLALGCNGDDGGLDGNGTTTDGETDGAPTTNGTTTNGTTTNGTTTNGATDGQTDGVDTTDGLPETTTDGTTGSLAGCGDGTIDPGEECDGDELGGVSCSDQGFDGGTMGCSATCTLDPAGCYYAEALQNDNGMCDFQELGCTSGVGGNPQDLLECYESTLTPPIEVMEVQYSIGDSAPLPTSLDLVVHEWAGPGNPPGAMIGEVALEADTDIVAGFYTLTLPTPIQVSAASFCVGFHGEDPMEGVRVDFTDADATGESWVRAAECGQMDFVEATDIAYPGNFCIRPTVTSQSP